MTSYQPYPSCLLLLLAAWYCMLTPLEARVLEELLAREQGETSPAPSAISAGDVVQIKPPADETFGGMLAVVTMADSCHLRAFLLRPHRGGCREAWLRLKRTDVERVGPTYWPNLIEFARRCEYRRPGCGWAPPG